MHEEKTEWREAHLLRQKYRLAVTSDTNVCVIVNSEPNNETKGRFSGLGSGLISSTASGVDGGAREVILSGDESVSTQRQFHSDIPLYGLASRSVVIFRAGHSEFLSRTGQFLSLE
jgi:hypothetical protein